MAIITLDKFLPIPLGQQSFTLKDDEVFYSIEGALSFGVFNLDISVGRSYRNELSAAYMGRQWQLFVESAAPTPNTSPQFYHKKWTWNNTSGVVDETSEDPADLDFLQIMDAASLADDRFNATPPWNEPLVLTYLAFMDMADGTGNCVAMCLASQFDQFSPAPPTRF